MALNGLYVYLYFFFLKRLTRSEPGEQRDTVLSAYIQHDLLGCTEDGDHRVSINTPTTNPTPPHPTSPHPTPPHPTPYMNLLPKPPVPITHNTMSLHTTWPTGMYRRWWPQSKYKHPIPLIPFFVMLQNAVMDALTSGDDVTQQYMARLFNAFASLSAGIIS